jgi:hypothetical protein
MIPASVIREVKERYPMIDLEINRETGRIEIWENHGKSKHGMNRRWLWDYENPDGSLLPICAHQIVNRLIIMDTRHWSEQRRKNLFKTITSSREEQVEKSRKYFKERAKNKILEDYNYIAGIKTFFMNPKAETISTKVFGE